MVEQKERAARFVLARRHHGAVTRIAERWRDSAIFCGVIAVGATLADRVLTELLMRIFNAPAVVKCGFFAAL
jgi:hypothetical protein